MVRKIALAYRIPMKVTDAVLYADRLLFPICPHCRCTLEREYQNYCDRCGQALAWQKYYKILRKDGIV